MGVISFSGATGTHFLELSRSSVPSFGKSCVFVSFLLEGVVCFLGLTSYSKASGFCFFWGLGNKYQLELRLLFLQEKQCFLFQVFTRRSWDYLQSQMFMKLGVSLKSDVHEDGSRTESVKVNHKAQVTAHGLAVALNTVNPRDAMSEQLMD